MGGGPHPPTQMSQKLQETRGYDVRRPCEILVTIRSQRLTPDGWKHAGGGNTLFPPLAQPERSGEL